MKNANFVEYGYGSEPEITKRWHARVIEDHQLWRSFGSPPFPLSLLPAPYYDAHLAILEGESIRREEEREEAERKQRKAQQGGGRR